MINSDDVHISNNGALDAEEDYFEGDNRYCEIFL